MTELFEEGFETPSHSDALMCGLNSLRMSEDLLDVTLLVEGKTLRAHRAVLASCSNYFRALFTNGMLESRQNEICLNGVTAVGIKLVVDYMYTSKLKINFTNVQDVLSVASHVQVDTVVEACSIYLQSQLDLENCIDIATIAETYSLIQLKRKAYKFMRTNLLKFSEASEFLRLTPQQIEYLLAGNFPVNFSQDEVLRILLIWFQISDVHEYAQKLKYARILLSRIHFNEIDSQQLKFAVEKTFIDENVSELYKLILEAYRQAHNISTAVLDESIVVSNSLVSSRSMELAIVIVGGMNPYECTGSEIAYSLSRERKWSYLTSIPLKRAHGFSAAVLNNDLYVIGRYFGKISSHPYGFRYNPRNDKWNEVAPMRKKRWGDSFSLNVISGRLYAIGGTFCEEEENMSTSSCECYNPETNKWKPIRPLPEYNLSYHAGATWLPGSEGRWLYISGGEVGDSIMGTLKCYDSLRDMWEFKSPMLTPRICHVMIAMGHRIYVCGGESGEEPDELVDTIDAYNVEKDSWEVVTRIPTPRKFIQIAGVGTKIYFVEGSNPTQDSSVVQCYDVENDIWSMDQKYPQKAYEHKCVTMHIPRCRNDIDITSFFESSGR